MTRADYVRSLAEHAREAETTEDAEAIVGSILDLAIDDAVEARVADILAQNANTTAQIAEVLASHARLEARTKGLEADYADLLATHAALARRVAEDVATIDDWRDKFVELKEISDKFRGSFARLSGRYARLLRWCKKRYAELRERFDDGEEWKRRAEPGSESWL